MANRGMSAAMLTEIAKQNVKMVHLVQFHFSTIEYITDWQINIPWDGNDYLSLGNLLSIPPIPEIINPRVGSIPIKFSGVNQANISTALTEDYTDIQVINYIGLLNTSYSLIVDPILIYDGRIDNYELNENPGEGTSTLTWHVASHWADFEKRSGRRTNDNDQQNLFSGDKGFEFSSEIVKDLKWGKP